MDAGSEEKQKRLERMLEKGQVRIHLDPRRPGVVVPSSFRSDYQLILKLSYRFDPPDLSLSDWGVRETLSFSGQRFGVAVPWTAIYAITGLGEDDEACMYPDDMPRELFEAAAKHFGLTGDEVDKLRETRDRERPVVAEVKRAKAGLRVVGPDEVPEPASADPVDAPASPGAPISPVAPVPLALAPQPPAASANEPEPPTDPDKPRRNHLKLVK